MTVIPYAPPQARQSQNANGMPPASRLGPHSVEAEEAVLGSVLINAEILPALLEVLRPDDFFELKHAWLWEAMTALHADRLEVDYLTLIEALRQRGKLDEAGGPAFLSYLINTTPTHANAATYAELVQRAATRRRLITVAAQIAESARSAEIPAEAVLAQAETALYTVSARQRMQTVQHIERAAGAYYDELETLHANPDRRMGIPSGFVEVDRLLGGWQKSDLVIVAARPGVGKTSFLLNVATAAARAGTTVAIFTLEMGHNQLVHRLYAAETGINSLRLRQQQLDAAEWARIIEARTRIAQLPMLIDDQPGLTAAELCNRARRLQREHGVGLVLVDYLGLLTAGGAGRHENRVQEMSVISRRLKELARELNVPVLAAAQLNRELEKRGDRRPQLSDLRESGSIEQDADIVTFLYREEMHNPHTTAANQAEVIVAKHRNGPTGSVRLHFDKSTTQFGNLTASAIHLNGYADKTSARGEQ